jgi:Fic family protein
MTKLTDLLKEIDSLKDQLDKLKPLKKEDEEMLWKKFRLEWNYNSNHIEGNTLTYIQTELLLIFDKTTGDHEMREYEEMKAHDVAINLVKAYANDLSRELTEADIREFNKIILVRPFWGNAQTEDGQATRKLIQPGEYKKEPNSVKLQNGEMFHYASPEETPAKMNELMNWLRMVSSEGKLHPAQIAAQLHYDFVRIHPFDDSNGRTSRLLMNYVLLRNGFPPVIIKASDKKGYLTALNKADVGDLDSFVFYILENLRWSVELSLKAAKGEIIEEDDDVDKEIEVLKRREQYRLQNSVEKSIDKLEELYDQSIKPLFESLFEKHSNLNDLFTTNQYSITYDNNFRSSINKIEEFASHFKNGALKGYRNQFSTPGSDFSSWQNEWAFQYYHGNLKTKPNENFHLNEIIKIRFMPLRYEVYFKDKEIFKKPYSDLFNAKELKEIVSLTLKDALSKISGNAY